MLSAPIALLLLATSLAACSPGTPQSEREDARTGMGMMSSQAGGGMMDGAAGGTGMMNSQSGDEMGAGMMDNAGSMGDMMTIRQLLPSHEQVERTVEDVPGGVRTVTVSDDPEVTELIRQHVREMHARYDRDQQLWAYARDDRPWGGSDPPLVAYVYAADRKAQRPIRTS